MDIKKIMSSLESTPVDYTQFPSLITSGSQLKLGTVVYHVYGHLDKEPKEYTITREPFLWSHGLMAFGYRHKHYNMTTCCGDCGLDGANHNHNRLFTDREDAMRFIEECEKKGVYTGHIHRAD